MSCLRIPHRRVIYSLLLLFAVFFSLSFGHQSASATSVSFSYSTAESNYPSAFYEYNATNVGFNFTYVSIDAHSATLNNRSTQCFQFSNGSLGIDSPLLYVQYNAYLLGSTNSYFMLKNSCGSDSMTLTFYDYNPASTEPCPDCPEVPELPYGEKLDHLTAAIIFVPATMLVIYFMFAIYSMFFRGLK